MATLNDFMLKAQRARAASGVYNYFSLGTHLVQTNSCQIAGDKKQVLAYEGMILWTNSQDPNMQPGRIGHNATATDNVAFESHMKSMLMALNNLTEEDINSLSADELFALGDLTFQKQECAGTILLVEVAETVSKGRGKTPAGEKVQKRVFKYFCGKDDKWGIDPALNYPVLG